LSEGCRRTEESDEIHRTGDGTTSKDARPGSQFKEESLYPSSGYYY